MKKTGIILAATMLLISIALIAPVVNGIIVVTPAWPLSSPSGIFTAEANPDQPINNVLILLVMSDTCYQDWSSGTIGVSWTGENGGTPGLHAFAKGDFIEETVNSVKIPVEGGVEGKFAGYTFTGGADGGYTVAEARSHLGISESESIWWAAFMTSTLKLNTDAVTITVSLPSGSPNMIMYLAGSKASAAANTLDVRIPPTNGGWVVPEVPIAIAAFVACFGAFFLLKRKDMLRLR